MPRPDNNPEQAAAILRERERQTLDGDDINAMNDSVPCLWCGETTYCGDALCTGCFLDVEYEAAKIGVVLVDTPEGLRVREFPASSESVKAPPQFWNLAREGITYFHVAASLPVVRIAAEMEVTQQNLKAPFPAFGGKSRVASIVWPRLSPEDSPARNYVEPFCFSTAMLLLRPDEPKIETINDLNSFVANFWRAIQADPEGVAAHADWPVNETDLHARHAWLVRSHEAAERLQAVRDDATAYDARIAGWWCWGACMWIGSGWCEQQIPHMSNAGQGVLTQQIPHMDQCGRLILSPTEADLKRPQLCNGSTTHGQGVHKQARDPELNSGRGMLPQKLPELNSEAGDAHELVGEAGRVPSAQIDDLSGGSPGVHGRPQLADAYSRGRGVNSNDELTDCERRRLWLIDWFTRLSNRLRPVRVCCGHWDRVCDSDSTLTRLGKTAVFLDPPYRKKLADGSTNRASHIYANDKSQCVDSLVDEVQAWCLKWGDSPDIRIAVCGLEGEYPLLDAAGWEKVAWKSQGGYGNRNKDNENAARERIWFNAAAALKPERRLFD